MSKLVLERALLAGQTFRPGELIRRLVGERASAPTLASIRVGENDFVTDEYGMGVAHSCSPSAYVQGGSLLASRTIASGERVTINRLTPDNSLGFPFTCRDCGYEVRSDRCGLGCNDALL